MADLLIRNVPEKLHAELKRRAQSSGRSLSDEAEALLNDIVDASKKGSGEAESRNAFDALREPFEGAFLTDEEHADFMQAVERMRREKGRPVPDFE